MAVYTEGLQSELYIMHWHLPWWLASIHSKVYHALRRKNTGSGADLEHQTGPHSQVARTRGLTAVLGQSSCPPDLMMGMQAS